VFEKAGYNIQTIYLALMVCVTISQSEGLPTGTYYYILKYKDSEAKGREKVDIYI
jgi:hypothetical protein